MNATGLLDGADIVIVGAATKNKHSHQANLNLDCLSTALSLFNYEI